MIKSVYILLLIAVSSNYSFSQKFEWAGAFGSSVYVLGRSVIVDDNGNVITAGDFQGTVDFDPGVGVFNLKSKADFDIYITKLDNTGNFLWAKSIGGQTAPFGSEPNARVFHNIAVDNDGNLYICGSFDNTRDFDPGPGVYNLTSSGGFDIFIVKLDSLGRFIFAKSFGGIANDEATAIAIDKGTLFVTGTSSGDTFILKLNIVGNFYWLKSLSGSNSKGISICVDKDGNIIITGSYIDLVDFDPGIGVYNLQNYCTLAEGDIYILKLGNNGDFLWVKGIDGSCYSNSGPYSITTDQNGNIYTTGIFYQTVDFDPGSGVYNLNQSGMCCNEIAFILKLDTNGNFIWARSFDYSPNVVLYEDVVGVSIKTDKYGNVYSTGVFRGEVDFDPGPAIYKLMFPPYYFDGAYLSKLDTNGDFVWALAFGGGNSNVEGLSIYLDKFTNIYLTGWFDGSQDFNPGPETFTLIPPSYFGNTFILKLSQCQATSDTAHISNCSSYTWLDGKTYTESTDTARYIIENKAGCDSIITLDLTILKSDTTHISTIACNEYKWYDMTLNQSGIYQHTEPKMNGCDSVLTLNLTILKPDSVQYQISACDVYTWHNINYTESGTYLHNEINTNGCDSIGILNLTINRSALSQMSMTSCDSLTWNGQTYNQSGIYQYKTQTTAGCDSLITLDLKINKSDYITIKHSTCDSFTWNGTKYVQSGNYMYSTNNINGCDSLTILELTISDNIERTDEISICDGDSVKIFGNWVTEEGSISETFTSSSGCDSIQTYYISVLQLPEGNISGSICEGDSVYIIDRWFDAAGTYTLKKSNPAGCDSLINVNISIIKNKINYDTLSLCRGDTLNINGQIITTQTDIQKNLTSAELCDSLVYVHVLMLEPAKSSQDIRLCPGDSIYIAGRWINSAQEVEETYQGSNGCDSTAVKNIRLIPEPDKPEMEIDCQSGEIKLSINSSADWQILWNNGENSHNATYKDSTEAIVNLKAIEGCERQFTIQLPQIPDITLIKQPNDTILKAAEILQIDLGLNLSEWKIGWQPDDALDCDTCSKVNITVSKNTEFVIKLKHESGCEYELSFRVEIENGKFDVPNIFSPDGDSKNDYWKVGIPTGIELQQCSIYDRWGEKVYSTSGEIKWDGRIRQKNAMQGVYVYVIEYKDETGEIRFLSGDVTLIR